MARFDVYRFPGEPWLLDCQTDLLDYVETRLVVPLIPLAAVRRRIERLNPVFRIDDEDLVMMTPLMAAVPIEILRRRFISLRDRQDVIMNAIDMLLSGF
ncbi:MAG: CcdB family protein [Sphingomonas sp.]|uniref:CcdB family protein n=1 Tax=Sphingomonas sp. TaxID=28214 RepID=UPI001AC5E9CC|nr:CcdB family protein [Sphingomonas sp.]MBN8807580.1 CcdB family protein [Sphingomonas sp.]